MKQGIRISDPYVCFLIYGLQAGNLVAKHKVNSEYTAKTRNQSRAYGYGCSVALSFDL